MSSETRYEVYALKYAERAARRPEHFIGGDPHDVEMDMDYFIWAVVGPDQTWVVDTGFDRLDADRRNRNLVRTVASALSTIGVEAASVTNVILTHLHYDHVGGFAHFPNAVFHLQDDEMAYASGRDMAHDAIAHAYTPDHVADLVHLVYDKRVRFHDGDADLAEGLSVHKVGGHTKGLQVVRVRTALGWLVLASDASHYYENMEAARPFPIVYHLGQMLAAYERCRELADSPAYVIPGHDPKVFDRYPAARSGLEGIAVRLDVEPEQDGATAVGA
ncbi:MAG: N-acyl homoserine lactonase family protein [Actinomycetota bacterium]